MKSFMLVALTSAILASTHAVAAAADVHLQANERVEITFDLPAQPDSHSGFFMFAGFTAWNGTLVKTELFDEQGMLASTTGDYVFPLFTDPTNYHSGQPYAVDIDFSRLADGATGAKLVLTVLNSVPGAFISFNSNDLVGQGFGDSGTFSGFDAVVTSVIASPVPETNTALLAGFGLAGLLSLTASRRRAARI